MHKYCNANISMSASGCISLLLLRVRLPKLPRPFEKKMVGQPTGSFIWEVGSWESGSKG